MLNRDENYSNALLLIKQWFRYHVAAYLAGNAILFGLNAAFADHWWAFWVVFFWGILLTLHFFLIIGHGPNDDWAHARAMREEFKRYETWPDKNVDDDPA